MKKRNTRRLGVMLGTVLCLCEPDGRSQDVTHTTGQVPNDQHEVLVEIPEVFELANIAIAISDIGLDHPNRVHKRGVYYERVLNYFRPFKEHSLIKQPDLHRNNTYFFRDNSACYVFDEDRIAHGGVYPPMRTPNLFGKHLALAEDFAKASKFRKFYAENLSYYRAQIRRYEQKVPLRHMGAWLEERFPIRNHRYKVIFSPLLGSSHETCGFETNGIRETIMFVSGPGEPGESEDAVADALLAQTVFTEIDHNYVNPVTATFSAQVGKAYADLDYWSHPENADSYPKPDFVFNEYMTWAVFLLYAQDSYDEKTFGAVRQRVVDQMVRGRKCGRFKEFSEELLQIYRDRTPGQTIPDLYPAILAWADRL